MLVVRHGLTQWNTDQRWQGWADIPLSDTGRRQAEVAAKSLSTLLRGLHGDSYIRIASSDLKRAHATARAFADELGTGEVVRIEALRERNVGEWAGLTSREINLRWPGVLDRWRNGEHVPLPGGEDEAGFRERIFGALSHETRRAAESGTPSVLVSHGGAIRTIEALLEIEARHVANVGGRWFFWNGTSVVPGHEVDLLDDPAPLATRSATENGFSRGTRGGDGFEGHEQPAVTSL